MCTHNSCEGSGWVTTYHRYGSEPMDIEPESEPCQCNPAVESREEHSDKECARDVTLALMPPETGHTE